MKKIAVWVSIVFATGLVLHSAAAVIPATPVGQPVVPGEWHLGLEQVLAMADETGIPVVSFWANTGCSRCDTVASRVINTPEFTAWRQERQLLMVTGTGKTGAAGEVYTWTKQAAQWDGSTSCPFIRVYWKQKDGTVRADSYFSGYPYRASPQTLIDKIESFLVGFTASARAEFAFTAQPEMEPNTPAVPLPLKRDSGYGTLTNTLLFARTLEAGGVTNWSETLVWAEGETNRNVAVTNQGHYVGGSVTLTLQADGEADQTATINMVAEQPVNIHNPRFVGEPFNFGEWTMDLDAATNAVAADPEARAGTMVFFTGLWCPYCTGFENEVLDSPEFLEFASTNRLALVVISIPSRDGRVAGSLLTHNVFTNLNNAADRRIGLNGTSYMTRHGITPEAGMAQIEWIWAYERLLTLPDKTFVNLPAVVMLRKDGTIASRIPGYYCYNYYLEDVGSFPPLMHFPLESNMTRLYEQWAMTADEPRFANEENNNYAIWTRQRLGIQQPAEEALAANDEADFFVLEALPGTLQSVRVSGAAQAGVEVSIISNGVPVATSSGLLCDNVAAEAPIFDGVEYHVCVKTNDPAFYNTNTAWTLYDYAATTEVKLLASERAHSLCVAAVTNATGVFTTQLDLQAGSVYRFTYNPASVQLDVSDAPGAFTWQETGLLQALDNATVQIEVTLSPTAGADERFAWQIWRPGEIGFTQIAQTVGENAGTVQIAVERTGGGSGACTVAVRLDADASSATADEDFEDVFGADGVLLAWADGEAGVKTLDVPLLDDLIYEGDETIAMFLEVVAGAVPLAAGYERQVVTLVENDKPVIGRLCFATAEPFFATLSPLKVVAVENSVVKLGVERVEGASSAVSAGLAVSAGTVAPELLNWAHNDPEAIKYTEVTLPSLAEVPNGVVTVTLLPEAPIRGVTRQTSVAIQMIAADAPRFAQQDVAFAAQTLVAVDQEIALEQLAGGRLTLTRLSGALPSGISAKADAEAGLVRLQGVPKKSGEYSAIFQINERRAGRQIKGGVVRVSFTVVDLAEVNAVAAAGFGNAEGAVVDTADTHRMTGTLQLGLSRSGRISARYRHQDGSVSFSASNWSACDAEGTVTAQIERNGYLLNIDMDTAGTLDVQLQDPAFEQPLEARVAVVPWSRDTPAADFMGYYTVALEPETCLGALSPIGSSYMTLTVAASSARNGKTRYVGKLADGTSYSGNATLIPTEDGNASLAVFTVKQRRTLGVRLVLRAGAAEDYRENPSAVLACGDIEPFWRYNDRNTADASFDIALEVCGGYYSSADSLLLYFDEYHGDGPMCLIAAADGENMPESAVYGIATDLPLLELDLTDTTMRLAKAQENPTATRLRFNRRTGVFKGTFRLPFEGADGNRRVTASYEGVLLPGWTVENCQCGDEELDLPLKPFGIGAYWFKDKLPVEDDGKPRLVPVTRGYPLLIDRLGEP